MQSYALIRPALFTLAPETAHYLYPEEGLLTHANHFEDRSDVRSEFERILPNTLCRAPRLKRLLSASAGELGVTAVDARHERPAVQ